MIRLALVSYLNTRPFTDGLEAVFEPGELEIQLLPPAQCAEALAGQACDMALVPVGALPDFQGIGIMKDHCIGADGDVDSVFVLSDVPIQEAKSLVLDAHSRSSNVLAQILLKKYWKVDIPIIPAGGDRFAKIGGAQAGVAIGDRAYAIRDRYKYVYDLAGEWKRWTGLPFVFAVWAYRDGAVSAETLDRIRTGLEKGRSGRKESAAKWASEYNYSIAEAERYLCKSISYAFDSQKHQAFERYMGYLKEMLATQVPSGSK